MAADGGTDAATEYNDSPAALYGVALSETWFAAERFEIEVSHRPNHSKLMIGGNVSSGNKRRRSRAPSEFTARTPSNVSVTHVIDELRGGSDRGDPPR